MFIDALRARLGAVLPGDGIVVSDPDELLRGAPIADRLAGEGIDVLFEEDPVDLRLSFDSLDQSRAYAVIASSSSRAKSLPADIQALSIREVSISADDMLQPLQVGDVVELAWDEIAAAWEAATTVVGSIDERATTSLLLRTLYGFDPDSMSADGALLLGLLHYHRQPRVHPMSESLATEFASRVQDPLPGIKTRDAIERRELFVDWLGQLWDSAVAGDNPDWLAKLTRPPLSDVLDEYFKDGSLAPVLVADASVVPFGAVVTSEAVQDQIDRQLADINAELATQELDHQAWRRIGESFGVVTAQQMRLGGPAGQYQEVRNSLEQRFVPWVLEAFPALTSLPAIPSPVVVHRAIRAMQLTRSGGKAALVVMDGMSLAAWELIAPGLSEIKAHLTRSVSFAWIPTLTTVSRQAIFAGTVPAHFAASIDTTAKEGDHWRAAWGEEAGLGPSDVAYGKLRLADSKTEVALLAALQSAGLGRQIIGLAVEDIDLIIHSEVFDEESLYQRLASWKERKVFLWLVQVLLRDGYRVYLTSDHGFLGVNPIGGSKAGATADKHGRFERYADLALADAAAARVPEAWRRWDGYGLPPKWHLLFAPVFEMYFTDRHTRLTHGGPTMEEVLVPWVEIYR